MGNKLWPDANATLQLGMIFSKIHSPCSTLPAPAVEHALFATTLSSSLLKFTLCELRRYRCFWSWARIHTTVLDWYLPQINPVPAVTEVIPTQDSHSFPNAQFHRNLDFHLSKGNNIALILAQSLPLCQQSCITFPTQLRRLVSMEFLCWFRKDIAIEVSKQIISVRSGFDLQSNWLNLADVFVR
jgi:hypothetical protein